MNIPRTLLLTLWPPDAKYKILYKNVACLPAAQMMCATLQRCTTDAVLPFRHRAFEPRQLHWRLRSSTLNHLFIHHWQAARLARDIAAWAQPFKPDVLWVLPELGAAVVGVALQRLLGVPLHLTAHDAHETARFIVPPLYYPVYAAAVRRSYRAAASVDAISEGMRDHLQHEFPHLGDANTTVMPPSMNRQFVPDVCRIGPETAFTSPVRRIGMCGSMRVTATQWKAFLELLASLPYDFELVTFAYEDLFHQVSLPPRVRVMQQPFAETESDLILAFRRAGVHALHLGMFREPQRALFGRTSLSAKLTTYAAAGLPILVDAREDSAAWRLIQKHGAGVMCGDDPASNRDALARLFSDAAQWESLGAGARRLCLEEFDLHRNLERFCALLTRTASAPGR